MREYIMPLSVGLTIFLFGIQLIRMGLQPLAESKLQQWLQKTTKTPYHGILTGAFATMAVQSSSAVTVMTIECIHIGLFTFFQSVGIIIGANVGTTFTAQIMAWNVEAYAPYLLVCGALLWLLPSTKYRCLGLALSGFSCLFLGLSTIKLIYSPIHNSSWLEQSIAQWQHSYLFCLLLGVLVTAVIQSSSASTALAMGLVTGHMIPLPMAVAFVLGGNIGTCFTALLVCIGANRAAKRAALAHAFFNIGGVMLFFPFIRPFAEWITTLSDYPDTQLAYAHLFFNLACTVLILPFIRPFARLIQKCVPDHP